MKLGIGRWVRVAFAVAPFAFLTACPPSAQSPQAREDARQVVLLTAEGIRVADDACAAWGEVERASGDPTRIARARDVLTKCSDAAHDAAKWLTAAEATVDTWSAASSGQLACLVGATLPDLRALEGVLTTIGVKVPAAVDDAVTVLVRLAPLVTGTCSADAGAEGG